MSPPIVAHALIAAAAPPTDYECIAGDLHEEYVRRVRTLGVAQANRWYWAQALASIAPLLSYSRTRRSVWSGIGAGLLVIGALLGLLLATEAINDAIAFACGGRHCPVWADFSADWAAAALFGAVLALCVRNGGVRFVFWSAVLLVSAIVVPTLLGYSSRLPLAEWLLLFGAVPAMCAGAMLYQIILRRPKD